VKTINWRNLVVGVFMSSFVMAACGDGDDGGDESGTGGRGGTAGAGGRGGSAGSAGESAGESGIGGSAGADGGDGGSSRGGGGSGQGGTSGDGGAAGDGAGHGGDAGEGGAGTGGTPMGGTNAGGTSGGGMGGNTTSGGTTSGGRAGGGMAGSGVAGGGMAGGGMAGGGMAGGGMAGGGMAGGGMAGAGMAGAGMAGGGMAGATVGGSAGMAGAGGGTNTPENCENTLDDDGDTLADCADSDCALPCALSCPAGTTRAVYAATDLPLSIADDGGRSFTTSTLAISATGMIADLAVQVSVSHPFVSDLALVFEAPRARLFLSTFNGDDGADYTRTVFARSGSTAIASGDAPFTGVYRPDQPLEWVYGLPLQGIYQLSVSDFEPTAAGSITGFSIATCECREGCEFGPLACQNALDDDADGLVDCDESACAGEPACTTPSEWACGDGIDNDGDGQTDCGDFECAWLCTTLGPSCSGPDRLFSYGARGLPLTIPATPAFFNQEVFASAPGTVVGTAVRLDVTHGYVSDLSLYLVAPSGEEVLLVSGNGGSGNDYLGTILADSATRGVIGTTGNNTAPFSSTYRPESPFSILTGKPAQGLFIADIYDTFTGDGGTVNDFTVGLCVTPP
jgi:subtilisin-like proprotein convertase family protein